MKILPKDVQGFLLMIAFILTSTLSTFAQDGQAYTIQENDWLSKIAKQYLNNAQDYQKIIDATNAKAASDPSYKTIKNANDISIGQRVWIPSASSNTTTTVSTTTTTTTTTSKPQLKDGNMLKVPATNCDIRVWYNYQVVAIGKINARWKEEGLDLKTRAEKAFELRHNARINARYMMPNQDEVKALQARDMKKYGNPDGPTFEYLVKKNTDKGKTLEEAYEGIIASSSRTSPVYNNECQ